MNSGEEVIRALDRWAAAVAFADELAAAVLRPLHSTQKLPTWDHHGVRGMVAVTAYTVALRENLAVGEVELSRVLVPLLDRVNFLAQSTVLLAAGHDLDEVGSADPVVQQWQWLKRTWNPDDPPEVRWDGMSRGVDPDRPDPAVNVLAALARMAVQDPLVLERGGIARGSGVEITSGRHTGCLGHVAGAHFDRASDHHDLAPGPPTQYVVRLGAGNTLGIALIAAEHLSVIVTPQP